MHEPSFTWSGHLPPKIYKSPIYSNKVFLGGVPWDITEGIFKTYSFFDRNICKRKYQNLVSQKCKSCLQR